MPGWGLYQVIDTPHTTFGAKNDAIATWDRNLQGMRAAMTRIVESSFAVPQITVHTGITMAKVQDQMHTFQVWADERQQEIRAGFESLAERNRGIVGSAWTTTESLANNANNVAIAWDDESVSWKSGISLERQAREQMIQANRTRARFLRKRVAERTAERLLLEHLNDEQKREWETGKFFHVETAGGRRRYRIERGTAGNVKLVRCQDPPPIKANQIREGVKFCAHVCHPDGWVPHEDNVLAQKLLLESEGGEEIFLAMANITNEVPGSPPRTAPRCLSPR